jgi:putative transposase
MPAAIAAQNRRRSSRPATGGRPGDDNGARPDRSERRFRMFIATSFVKVLRRPLESAQYTSIEFGKRCREAGVRPSMGSVGDAYDNAMAESFFATLECELLDRCRFKTQAEARIAVFEFIEGFYNPRRRHSSLRYLSPIKFERQFAEATLQPGAHEHAVVLAAVKERPGNVEASFTVNLPAVLDSRSTQQPRESAGRDEKMLSAEPKDRPKQEDRMLSN